jgi:hypothetical protein
MSSETIEKDSITGNSEEEIEGISNEEYQKIFKVPSRKSKVRESKQASAPAPATPPIKTPNPEPPKSIEPLKEAPKHEPTEKPKEELKVKTEEQSEKPKAKRGRKELPAELKKPKPPHPFTQIKMVKEEVENLKKQLSESKTKTTEIKTPQEPKINPDEFDRKYRGEGYSKKEIEELRKEVEELKRPKHGIEALSEKQRKLWEMMRN